MGKRVCVCRLLHWFLKTTKSFTLTSASSNAEMAHLESILSLPLLRDAQLLYLAFALLQNGREMRLRRGTNRRRNHGRRQSGTCTQQTKFKMNTTELKYTL